MNLYDAESLQGDSYLQEYCFSFFIVPGNVSQRVAKAWGRKLCGKNWGTHSGDGSLGVWVKNSKVGRAEAFLCMAVA
jgi:hypothetical protein